MAKFRKKPVVVEAIQWTGENGLDLKDFIGSSMTWNPMRCEPLIHTLEGTMAVSVNDWVIRGVKGECYPCKPDIFEATYEPV